MSFYVKYKAVGRKISIFLPFFPDSRDERAVMCRRFIIGVHNDQLSALIFVLFFFFSSWCRWSRTASQPETDASRRGIGFYRCLFSSQSPQQVLTIKEYEPTLRFHNVCQPLILRVSGWKIYLDIFIFEKHMLIFVFLR